MLRRVRQPAPAFPTEGAARSTVRRGCRALLQVDEVTGVKEGLRRPLNVVWFGTAKSGSFIEAAGIANDTGRKDFMAQNQPFEIPQQLRELAERNVEQARTAYGQLMAAMAQATGMWTSAVPSNEMTSGFKVVRERAIQFAKQNAEACFAAASELANANDIQDLLAIQSRSAQTQMQAYALQAQELGRLMAEAAQGVQPRS